MSGGNGRLIADRYELVKLIGQGGMGYVWQAHDLVLDRDVAVKEVFVPDPGGERNRQAFREARAAARLNHPGIVTIHDLVIADGRSWIVMELVRALSLDDTIREDGPLPPHRVARIGLEMLTWAVRLSSARNETPPEA
jgi:eukaryotic-like serine/threonine-protein kinase